MLTHRSSASEETCGFVQLWCLAIHEQFVFSAGLPGLSHGVRSCQLVPPKHSSPRVTGLLIRDPSMCVWLEQAPHLYKVKQDFVTVGYQSLPPQGTHINHNYLCYNNVLYGVSGTPDDQGGNLYCEFI